MDLLQFADRMREKGKNAEVSINQAIVKLALDIVDEVASGTPFNSGRAASNWLTAVGNTPTGYADNPFQNNGAQESIDNARHALAGYSGGVIHIVNNVPYIAELNHGSSQKAPAMFVQAGIARATYKFKSYKLNL